MILPFVMRDTAGALVTATPTVTADGSPLTVSGTSAKWTVDAPLGSLVSCTVAGAVPLDVVMPTISPSTIALEATVSQRPTLAQIEATTVLAKESTVAKDATVMKAASYAEPPTAASNATAVWSAATRALTDKVGFSGTATNMRGTDGALLASSYVAPTSAPTAAQNASAVWGATTRTLTSAGSSGATLAEIEASTVLAKEAAATANKNAIIAALPDAGGTGTTAQEVWEYGSRTLTSTGAITAPYLVTESTLDTSNQPLGICVNGYGSPLPGVRVVAELGGELAFGPTFSAMDGSFRLDVARGYTYTVKFTYPTSREMSVSVNAPA